MRGTLMLSSSVLAAVLALAGCRRAGPSPIEVAEEGTASKDRQLVAPLATIPPTLKARIVSWDVGYQLATEKAWIDRVVAEVRGAAEADVVVFPEWVAGGLGPYAPAGERRAEFITRRMRDAVLPAVQRAAAPGQLVVLGTYPHQEAGWEHAFNRAPVLIDGSWRFVDKLDPTPAELLEESPVRAGDRLPLFSFRGGTAAVVICFSLEMPEVSAALKKAGVQLVIGPSATEDEDGVARVLRTASARAVELGAAVLVAPLVGAQEGWANRGSAALYLPAQKGIDHRPRESVRRGSGIAHDDFVVPWRALIELRQQRDKKRPETRPFLAPAPGFTLTR